MNHELIVVSDLHIKNIYDSRGEIFIKFLRHLDGRGVKNLVLLGDIFDFCFGASRYFREKFSPFGKELSRLSKEGTQVYFVAGNHEFFLGSLDWEGVTFIETLDFQIKMSDGLTFAFSHGDRLYAPWHYHIYNFLIKMALSKVLALLLPQGALDRLALSVSSASRKRGYERRIEHKGIIASIEHWLNAKGAEVGIVGHFHVPYHIKTPSGKSRILCLDSWDKPNYLAYQEGSFYRCFFKKDGLQKVRLSSQNFES